LIEERFQALWGLLTKRKKSYAKPQRTSVVVETDLARPACSAARYNRQSG
jgi:hypothetical protein